MTRTDDTDDTDDSSTSSVSGAEDERDADKGRRALPSDVTQTSVTLEVPDYWKPSGGGAGSMWTSAARRRSSRPTSRSVLKRHLGRRRLIMANTGIGLVVVALSSFIFLSDPAAPTVTKSPTALERTHEAPAAAADFTGVKNTECLAGAAGDFKPSIPDEVADYRITGTPLTCDFARDVIDRLLAHVAVKPGETHFALKDLFSQATDSHYSGSCVRHKRLTRCEGPGHHGKWSLEVKDEVNNG